MEPRYEFPAGFAKSQVLFNLPRAVNLAPPRGASCIVSKNHRRQR